MIAAYTFDAMTIELLIALPDDYPLGRMDVCARGDGRTDQQVSCSRQIGMSQKTLWKKWMLQLMSFINTQVELVS